VRRADRVVVLDGGRVVEEGTHDALLRASGLYARLYRGQLREGSSYQLSAIGSQ
jgi:ABC-type multidrug transport system fused ATPase/permease subunit